MSEITGQRETGGTQPLPERSRSEIPYVEVGERRFPPISGGQTTPQAQQAEVALTKIYQSDLSTVGFERRLITEITDLMAALGPRHADAEDLENRWEVLSTWRKFAKDSLPDFEGNHKVMFSMDTQAGERLTSLINKGIKLEAILEPRAVREAIVKLYPKLMRGEFFFGRAGEVLIIEGGKAKTLSEIRVAAGGAAAGGNIHGITETMDCQIALEVLRAWLVHPRREKTAVWEIYANDHDGLARWYPGKKWGEMEGYLVGKALGRENLVETANGTGNYWEAMVRERLPDGSNGPILAINELVDNWEGVKEIARQGGGLNLGGFYDRARKIMETADAIHDLVATGISPENVVRLIVEKERFKYLRGKERSEAWSSLYTEVWKMLTERTPLIARQKKLENMALLRGLYTLRKISERQLNELLSVVEQVPEIESLSQRTLSPEGQILERGYSVFVAIAALTESIPIVNFLASLASFGILSPKWDPKTQESDQVLVRRLGINPLSAEIAAAGLLGYLIPHMLAGGLTWGAFSSAFMLANVGGVILTNITDFLNEKRKLPIFQTRMSYKEWPLKQGNVGGVILAPIIFVPGLLGEIARAIRRDHIREDPSRRRFLLGAAGLFGLAATAGLAGGITKEGEALKEADRKKKEFAALPRDQQEEIKRRERAEKENALYGVYRDVKEPLVFGPFDIKSPLVKQLKETIGSTWMFTPERKKELEFWFGRPFSEEEIIQFRQNPQSKLELLDLLQTLQRQGKITQEVVDFYK